MTTRRNVQMADPFFSADDRARIHREVDAILDGALSMGPNVRAFESEFAARVGVMHAVAMSSCTSALEAALQFYGVAGREVIVPAETFVATGMAVHLSGGIACFAEISPRTLCLDLDDVKRRVTGRTAGIILVHMAGLISPDIAEFRSFCDENGLFLIEDAAHSPGARLGGAEAGSLGHAGCFSFYPTKVITSGEGGMLTTNDDEIAAFARSYQHRGRDMSSAIERYVIPGRNVRMTEMNALLGRIQLGHLDEYLARRREIAAAYKLALEDRNEIRLVFPDEPGSSSFWKFPIILDASIARSELIAHMGNHGIATDAAYQPALHQQPVFQEIFKNNAVCLARTEDLLSRHLCLPCHPRMTDEDVAHVIDTLNDGIRRLTNNLHQP